MSQTIAVFGKASTGKTLVAAHLGMALGYTGEKTLVVGCDQKRDTSRAMAAESRPSLMEGLEAAGFQYGKVDLGALTVQVNPNVDVVELGPSQLISGNYGNVLTEALHLFDEQDLFRRYARIVFDVNDERLDSTFAPLLRRIEGVIAVCDDSLESLFVLNRMLRGMLIGAAEYQLALRLAGVVHNRSSGAAVFERYVQRSRVFTLLSMAESADLARLRKERRTLFALKNPPPHLERIVSGFLKIAEMMRGESLNIMPMMPLEDEEIWGLGTDCDTPE